MGRFQPGQPRPKGAGRKPGQRNHATIEAQEAVRAALNGKSIVERLLEIAREKPQREEDILLALIPYVAPRLTAATVDAEVHNTNTDSEKTKELADELERLRESKAPLSLLKSSGTG